MIISDELNDNPEQIKCGFKRKLVLKIAPNKQERDDQKQEIADGSLALSYNGSPDGSFESLDALLAKYPNGAIVGEVGNEGYQRPKLIPSAEGVDNVYIYSRETTQWENRGEWNGWNTAIRIKVTTPIFSIETAEYIANYIKTNFYAIGDYKQLVVFVEGEAATTIYTGYITTFKGGTDKDYEFAIFGGYNERQSKYYYGDTTSGLISDRTYYELDDTLKHKYDNYQTGVDKANNYLDNQTKQSYQDKRLDDHNDRLNDIESEFHETFVAEVEEKNEGNKWNVPTSATVDGKNYKVVDNQLFKISGIVGQTKKSLNLLDLSKTPTSGNNGDFKWTRDGNTLKLNGVVKVPYNYIVLSTNLNIPAGDYTIITRARNLTPQPTKPATLTIQMYYDNENTDFYLGSEVRNEIEVKAKTAIKPIKNMYIAVYNDDAFNNTEVEFMFVKGKFDLQSPNLPKFVDYFEGLQNTTIKNITSTNKEGVQVDKTKDITLTLKGAGSVGDEAILTKTSGTELFEVDVIRRMKEIDLTDANWYASTNGTFLSPNIQDAKPSINAQAANIVSSKYIVESADNVYLAKKDQTIALDNNKDLRIYSKDLKTPEQAKEAMKGVKLVYELATPTQEPKVKNLTLGDVSVLGQKGGEFQVNPIEPNIVEPKETRMKYDIKFWQEPTGGK